MSNDSNLTTNQPREQRETSSGLVARLALTEADYAMFERSCIPRDIVDNACIFRVDTFEGAAMFSRKADASHDYAGVVFPYFWPGRDGPREYRLRRDRPDEELQPDGQLKEAAKYLGAPRVRSMLYFPPGVDPALLDDISLPIVLCEGEKKALALWVLAWYGVTGDRPRFLPIGIPGVWNWRASVTVEKETGERKEVKGWIDDLNHIPWAGRTVIVLFDSNVHWNESVSAARLHLAYLLRAWLAQVMFATLPNDPLLNGPDDYLKANGPDSLLALIERAFDGVYPDCQSAREHFALRDWAQLDDIASLLFSRWGWDAEDKETFKALNCQWGGRRTKTFRLRQIDVYKRLQRLPEDATVSDRKQAERLVRDRRKKLLTTIGRTLSVELLKLVERGGQVTGKKRLAAKYQISHAPFLEAQRLAKQIYIDREYQGEKVFSPGQAREIAARVVGDKYLLANASEKIRGERQSQLDRRRQVERQAKDFDAKKLAFEKLLEKRAGDLWQQLLDDGYTRIEINVLFADLATRASDIITKTGRKNLHKKRNLHSQPSALEELPGLYQNSMGVVQHPHNSEAETVSGSPLFEPAEDSPDVDGSLSSPPIYTELGNSELSSTAGNTSPVTCSWCSQPMPFGVANCPVCGAQYTPHYWRANHSQEPRPPDSEPFYASD